MSDRRAVISGQAVLLSGSVAFALFLALGGWFLGRVPPAGEAKPTSKFPPNSPVPEESSIAATEKLVRPDAQSRITLAPQGATLAGEIERTTIAGAAALRGWANDADKATWRFHAQRPGFYTAELEYATAESAQERELELAVDERKRTCSLRITGGLDRFVTDEYTVAISTGGRHELSLRPRANLSGERIVIRGLRLIPPGSD